MATIAVISSAMLPLLLLVLQQIAAGGASLTLSGVTLSPIFPACPLPSSCTRRVYTVQALSSGAHSATLSPGAAKPLLLLLNGVPLDLTNTTTTSPLSLPLRLGSNIVDVTVSGEQSILELSVEGVRMPPKYGASLPFVEVEAEDANYTGTLLGPSFTFTELAAEASARRAVALDAPGAYVEFTLPVPSNAMAVRYSVPDGGAPGVEFDTLLDVLLDGVPFTSVVVTSNYSYQYGLYPFTKNASDGRPHHYFDTVRLLLPSLLPPGTRVRLLRPPPPPHPRTALLPPPPEAPPACPVPVPLREDCGYPGINASTCLGRGCCWGVGETTATPTCYIPLPPPPPPPQPGNATITLDVASFYALAPPETTPPPGFTSVIATGADPTGVRDSTPAFTAALTTTPGARVWVPPGVYRIDGIGGDPSSSLPLGDNVSVVGAGPWYSVLKGGGARLAGREAGQGGSSGIQVHGLALVGEVRTRNNTSPAVGVGGALSHSVLANLHISHQKCGMWINGPLAELLVSAVEIHDTMADGVNFHGGVVDSVVEQSFLRNTGDDCLASWSDARGGNGGNGSSSSSSTAALPNARNAFRGNTLVMPLLGNHAAIYGGTDNSIAGNEARDTLTEGGAFHVGARFTSFPVSGTTRVSNNSALRAGCFSGDYPADPGALWVYALEGSINGGTLLLEGNELRGSPLSAVLFMAAPGFSITGVTVDGLGMDGAGREAFNLVGGGGAATSVVTVTRAVAQGVPLGVRNCTSGFQVVDGGGNEGWGMQGCTPRGGAFSPLVPRLPVLPTPLLPSLSPPLGTLPHHHHRHHYTPGMAAAAAVAGPLWVHTPDISLELSGFGRDGGQVFLNTSHGFSTTASLVSWVGEPGTSFSVTSLTLGYCTAPTSSSSTSSSSSSSGSGSGSSSVCVDRVLRVTGQLPSGACCASYDVALHDEFSPVPPTPPGAPASIAWLLTVSDSTGATGPTNPSGGNATVAWRSTIHTDAVWEFARESPPDAAWWVPRGGATPASSDKWVDVLAMQGGSEGGAIHTMLGAGYVYEAGIAANREVMPVAMSVIASQANHSGLALFHDPSDALLAAVQDVAAAAAATAAAATAAAVPGGASNFSRLYNRLGQGAAPLGKGQGGASFTTFLVPLPSCDWRPAFAWARTAFPAHFLPASLLPPPSSSSSAAAAAAATALPQTTRPLPTTPKTATPPPHLATGLGMYTCAEASDVNVSYLKGAGATTIWDAHFFWPYQGLFLPPNASWVSNTGGGEEVDCGPSWHHGLPASRPRIQASYEAATALGLTTLAYFNLFHFGQDVQWPLGPTPPLPPPTPTDWTNSSLFLAHNLSASVLPGPQRDWQGSVVLDPGEPTRAAFLAAQLEDKVASFGAALAGIVVDELAPSTMINFAPPPPGAAVVGEGGAMGGGDGWDSAWCGKPCRFLLWGWMRAAAAAQRTLNGGGAGQQQQQPRLLLANFIGAQRVDVLASADGVFTENYLNRGALANAMALATTGKPPAILWTNGLGDIAEHPSPDAFFSMHAYLKLFPMAPVLGSDHAIDPASAPPPIQQAYSDWGHVFEALKGGCWHLAGSPVVTTPPSPVVLSNSFTVGGGCTDPTTQGGNGPVGALLLFLWKPVAAPSPQGGGEGEGEGEGVEVEAVAPQFLTGVGEGGGGGGLACNVTAPGTPPIWIPLPPPMLVNSTSSRWGIQGVTLGTRGAVLIKCTAAA